MRLHTMLVSSFVAVLAACGSSPVDRATPDATGGASDAAGDAAGNDADGESQLPMWMLEDVQPESPRVGQTYGLDSFTDKIIVVSLLEGF